MQSDVPKIAQSIAGQSMFAYVVQAVKAVNLNYTALLINPSLTSFIPASLSKNLTILEQKSPKGTAHAVMAAESFFKQKVDHLIIIGADCPLISPESIQALLEHHIKTLSSVSFLSSSLCSSDDMGVVNRDADGTIMSVSERNDNFLINDHQTSFEFNSGIYCFEATWLWSHLSAIEPAHSGELQLPDLISVAYAQRKPASAIDPVEPNDIFGVNTASQLAQAETWMFHRHNKILTTKGVRIHGAESVYIDSTVEVGKGSVIRPNTIIQGNSRVAPNCVLGPNASITDTFIGEGSRVENSTLSSVSMGLNVRVGPYCNLRPGTKIEDGVVIGTGVEIKNSHIGNGSNIHHFSYIGDCDMGSNVNVGAGTVTCNYDGQTKHKTVIGKGAFIGSSSMLVAPVTVGELARIGAGSVVIKDVPPRALVFGVPASLHSQDTESEAVG